MNFMAIRNEISLRKEKCFCVNLYFKSFSNESASACATVDLFFIELKSNLVQVVVD